MSEKNIDIVKDIYRAFASGDMAAILAHISEDMRGFGVVSERTMLPWHMQITRKADVPKFFQAIGGAAEFTRYEPRDFAAGGDHVYSTISFDATFKHNGRKVTQDNVMHRFTFKDGKVVEWRGTEDTAKISEAFHAAAQG